MRWNRSIWRKKSDGKVFQGRNDAEEDFARDCWNFFDLTAIVSSVTISNVEKRWITLNFDDLGCLIIDSKPGTFG